MTDGDVINSGGTKTSTSLLRRASSGEGEAWQRLVSLYAPVVYRWCRQWGLQPADAENVGQEVFVRVFRKLASRRGCSFAARGLAPRERLSSSPELLVPAGTFIYHL